VEFALARIVSSGTGVGEIEERVGPLGMTMSFPTTMGASSEAWNVWPERLMEESTASIMRMVTTEPEGIVTALGLGRGEKVGAAEVEWQRGLEAGARLELRRSGGG
jgi:hypothetical protein